MNKGGKRKDKKRTIPSWSKMLYISGSSCVVRQGTGKVHF